jgi:hypothetical protein
VAGGGRGLPLLAINPVVSVIMLLQKAKIEVIFSAFST